jgi:Big-like domain-containing protein
MVTLKSIAATPAAVNIPRGTTKQFTATGTFSDNSKADITSTCAWTSSNTSQVTITTTGLATAVPTASLSQTANISCSQSGISASPAVVTVSAGVLSSIAVAPVNPSVPVNQNITFSATGTFTDGIRDVTASVNWTASPGGVVTFGPAPNANVASVIATGTTTITATDPSTMIQGTTMLTGVTLTSISVADVYGNPTATINVGSTDQLIATATYSDHSMANITNSVTWACTPSSFATIDSSGLATGVAAGTCTITVSLSGVTSNAFTLTVKQSLLCGVASAIPYLGAQAGGGDRFQACFDRTLNTFSFVDLSSKAVQDAGTLISNATYPNLFDLKIITPTDGTAVEMPSTALLINPGTIQTRTFNPPHEPLAFVFRQSPFACPAPGTKFLFVTLPDSPWTTANLAYGNLVLSSNTLTINGSLLNGTLSTPETDNYGCDIVDSLLRYTDVSGVNRYLAVSATGLFVGSSSDNIAGLPAPTSLVSIATGDTFLGLIYEPALNPGTVTTVGFNATSTTTLTGFDPLTAGSPANGLVITLGTQSSPGLFAGGTGGTLQEGTTTDVNFAAIANSAATGKLVLYGITFNTVKNTPVSVLLLQQ